MAFTDMNDVEQELGEEKPPERNGNRNFMIIAGILGGIMVLALLCIAGLALSRYLPGQNAARNANATNEAQATALALSESQTASALQATPTKPPTIAPTNTKVPTNTAVVVLGPTKTPTVDLAVATLNALRTQRALASPTSVLRTPLATTQAVVQPTAQATAQATLQATTPPTSQATSRPTATALPQTGIAEELGTSGLLISAFVLVVVIFLMRRLRAAF